MLDIATISLVLLLFIPSIHSSCMDDGVKHAENDKWVRNGNFLVTCSEGEIKSVTSTKYVSLVGNEVHKKVDLSESVLNCLTDAGTVLELGTVSHMENGVEYSCTDDEPVYEGSGEEISVNSCPDYADGSDDITIGHFLICCISKRFKACVDDYGDSVKTGHFVIGKGLLKYCNIQKNGLRARIEPKGCFNGSRTDDVEDESLHIKKYTVWRQGAYDMRCGDDGIQVYRCHVDNKTVYVGQAWIDKEGTFLRLCAKMTMMQHYPGSYREVPEEFVDKTTVPTRKNLFDILSIVPAVVFSYKCLVLNEDRSLLTMCIITAHWLFFIISAFNGFMYEKSESYLSIRLMLLGALGVKVFKNVWPIRGFEDEKAVVDSLANDEIFFNRCNGFAIQSSTQTADLIRKNSIMRQKHLKEFSSTSPSPKFDSTVYTYTDATTKNYGKGRRRKLAPKSGSSHLISHPNSFDFHGAANSPKQSNTTTVMSEVTKELQGKKAAKSHKLYEASPKRMAAGRTVTPERFEEPPGKQWEILEPENSKKERKITYGDIITNPMSLIKFSRKKPARRVEITNVTDHTIMWALKTNLPQNFSAVPAHGLVLSGEQQTLIIYLSTIPLPTKTDRCFKIAIDYAFVNSTSNCFDKKVFKISTKRRHMFDVIVS